MIDALLRGYLADATASQPPETGRTLLCQRTRRRVSEREGEREIAPASHIEQSHPLRNPRTVPGRCSVDSRALSPAAARLINVDREKRPRARSGIRVKRRNSSSSSSRRWSSRIPDRCRRSWCETTSLLARPRTLASAAHDGSRAITTIQYQSPLSLVLFSPLSPCICLNSGAQRRGTVNVAKSTREEARGLLAQPAGVRCTRLSSGS